MANRDATTEQYFNQAGITVKVDASVDADEFDIIDNEDLLARLSGAPDNSAIAVSRGAGELDMLVLIVENTVFKYPSEYHIINQDGNLGLELSVDSIYVRDELQGQGIGVRSVMLSILEAKRLGFRSVTLEAAGSAKDRSLFFGYHVWPSLGFDVPLSTTIAQRLPEHLASCTRLSDLMFTAEGRQWWYDNGVALSLEFDLRDDGVSWQLFHEYAVEKEIHL